MTILFVLALYVTLASITNMSFTDIYALQTNEPQDEKRSKLISEKRTVHLKDKRSEDIQLFQEEIEVQSLEEVMKREQIPMKQVIATGYTAGVESTGKTPDHPEYGITFSGVKVKRDVYSTIAADLSIFPIGTILYIPDYGYGVVADKGSAIKGNKIDLYYETVEDVYTKWGKREVEVYIIRMGQGSLTTEQLVQLNESDALKVFQDELIDGKRLP